MPFWDMHLLLHQLLVSWIYCSQWWPWSSSSLKMIENYHRPMLWWYWETVLRICIVIKQGGQRANFDNLKSVLVIHLDQVTEVIPLKNVHSLEAVQQELQKLCLQNERAKLLNYSTLVSMGYIAHRVSDCSHKLRPIRSPPKGIYARQLKTRPYWLVLTILIILWINLVTALDMF